MLHNMWPLMLGQKPLKCQEKPSGVHKMQQITGAAGAQRSPRPSSWWGGGCLPLAPFPRTLPPLSAFHASPLPAPNFQTPSEVKSYIRP